MCLTAALYDIRVPGLWQRVLPDVVSRQPDTVPELGLTSRSVLVPASGSRLVSLFAWRCDIRGGLVVPDITNYR